MINVTKTFLPPQSEYELILKRAWNSCWLTNRGVLVQELESKLKDYLKVPNIIATTNGTLPLQIAIKALGLIGEIITTPFSYVATTSSIVWEGCTPVFVDIHSEYLTIDETKIEAAITSKTSAILATHVFGNPCAVDEIEKIAKKYNLKVIYDAAHCFGVTYKGKSIFNYGDVSTCSFHATKLFHTGEGGCMISNEDSLNEMLFDSHNFGHNGPGKFSRVGVNAKMSELQAAMGLAVFPHLNYILNERKRVVNIYNEELFSTSIKNLKIREHTIWNYSYYPIILDNEETLLKLISTLERENIFTRRYFFPSLNTIEYVNYQEMPISEDISKRVLCLPLFAELLNEDVKRIVGIIKKVL
ncbi:MAG: aminotransferase DegT [Lutibacter sp.]|nr:MAG: aminotransferase DegT [Lutibacter sp.]